jgi:hypothetical protein
VGGEEAGGDEQVARPVVKDDAAAGFTRVTRRVSEKGGEGVSSQGGRLSSCCCVGSACCEG